MAQSLSAFSEAAEEGTCGIKAAAQVLGAANALSAGVGFQPESSPFGGTEEAQRHLGSFPSGGGDRAKAGHYLSTGGKTA